MPVKTCATLPPKGCLTEQVEKVTVGTLLAQVHQKKMAAKMVAGMQL